MLNFLKINEFILIKLSLNDVNLFAVPHLCASFLRGGCFEAVITSLIRLNVCLLRFQWGRSLGSKIFESVQVTTSNLKRFFVKESTATLNYINPWKIFDEFEYLCIFIFVIPENFKEKMYFNSNHHRIDYLLSMKVKWG